MTDIKEAVIEFFKEKYEKEPEEIFSCGGRFEILGNHTDHNHGLCLAATCDLCITAAVRKRDDNIINFISKGYTPFSINLDELDVKEDEKGSQGFKPEDAIWWYFRYVAGNTHSKRC